MLSGERNLRVSQTFIENQNMQERRISIPKQQNVFWQMTGRMSAAGKLGRHKYEDPEKQNLGSRTHYIADDIKLKRDVDRIATI